MHLILGSPRHIKANNTMKYKTIIKTIIFIFLLTQSCLAIDFELISTNKIAFADGSALICRRALWTPANISTVVWIDPSDTNTLGQVAGLVSIAMDKSGNGIDMIQEDGDNQPTTGNRTIGGLNVLDVAGYKHLDNSNFTPPVSGNSTWFLVYEVDSLADSRDSLFAKDDGGYSFDVRAAETNGFMAAINKTGDSAGFSGGPFNGPSIMCTVFDYTSTQLVYGYVDGYDRTSDDGSRTYLTPLDAGTLYLFRGKTSNGPDGAFGEFVIIEDCSVACRQRMEGYLAWKYSLQAKLPINHPYKLAPPRQ